MLEVGETTIELRAGITGTVIQVIGSILDVHFPEDRMPKIYNALRVEVERPVRGFTVKETLWCEVAQHLGGGRVRAVALGATNGLQRGTKILDTRPSVSCPTGTLTA